MAIMPKIIGMERHVNTLRNLTLAVAVAMFSVPAFAVDCDMNQHRHVTLDWKQSPGTGEPVLFIGMRIVNDGCSSGPGATTYAVKDMPGIFKSDIDALNAFKYAQALVHLGITPADVPALLAYVSKVEDATGAAPGSVTPLVSIDETRLWLLDRDATNLEGQPTEIREVPR